jgi:hypothetical protein
MPNLKEQNLNHMLNQHSGLSIAISIILLRLLYIWNLGFGFTLAVVGCPKHYNHMIITITYV